MTAPSVTVYKNAYTAVSAHTRALTQITVAANDVCAVIVHTEDYSGRSASIAKTAGTATITSPSQAREAATASHCGCELYTFTVTGGGTLTLTVTATGTTAQLNACTTWTYVATGSTGIGNTNLATASDGGSQISASLVTSQDSYVVVSAADWNATYGTTTTLTPAGAASPLDAHETDGTADKGSPNGSRYSSRGGHWASVSSGTVTYGVTAPTSSAYDLVLCEILGTPSTVNAGLAPATGTAPAPAVPATPQAPRAPATGTAPAVSVTTATAGIADASRAPATATAPSAAPSITVLAGPAPATGTAPAGTAVAGAAAPPAPATGTAPAVSVVTSSASVTSADTVAITVTYTPPLAATPSAPLAPATGTAPAATAGTGGTTYPPVAPATAGAPFDTTANSSSLDLIADSPVYGYGYSYTASVSTVPSGTGNAPDAAATGTAPAPVPRVTVPAGNAAATATAPRISAGAGAGPAPAAGTARPAIPSAGVPAPPAQAGGTAAQPVVSVLTEIPGPAYAAAAGNTVTTAPFTPAAGALLVALAACGNGNGHTITAMSVTDSSGSGSWTPLAGTTFGAAGYAGVWARPAFTGSATVTFTGTPATLTGVAVDVRQFTGASAAQLGVTALLDNTTGTGVPITPGTAGSQVVGAFGTASGSKTLTGTASTSIYGQYNGDPAGSTVAAFEAAALSCAGTLVTLGFTNPAAVNAIAVAEILPGAGVPATAARGHGTAGRAAAETGGYLFRDEFDGPPGTFPGPAWNVETGNPGNPDDAAEYTASTTYVFQDGSSHLCLATGKAGTGGAPPGRYPSGWVDTYGTFALQAGQSLEFSLRLEPPAGNGIQGTFPAAWMMGVTNVISGGPFGASTYPSPWAEADIVESYGGRYTTPETNFADATLWDTNGSPDPVHLTPGAGFTSNGDSVFVLPSPMDGGFHVYRIDCAGAGTEVTEIRMYLDGALYASAAKADAETAKPGSWGYDTTSSGGLYLVISAQVDTPYVPPDALLPATVMTVDYVRAWRPAGPNPNEVAAPGAGYAPASGTAPAPAVAVTATAPPAAGTGTGPAAGTLADCAAPASPATASVTVPQPAGHHTTPALATGTAGSARRQLYDTGWLYPATAATVTGPWANLPGAQGSTLGDPATWTSAAHSVSGVLETSGYDVQSSVPNGAILGDLTISVRHAEDTPGEVASVTAQAYAGASPIGSPQALTVSDVLHDDEITVTGLAYEDLADLRVRLTATRT